MEDFFVCEYCRRKRAIEKKSSGVVIIAHERDDRSSLAQLADFFSQDELIKYNISKDEIRIIICDPCIKQAQKEYDQIFYWSIFGGLFLLLIQFFTGMLWFFSAAGGILILTGMNYRRILSRRSDDIADRLAVGLMKKKLAKQMAKDPTLNLLTRQEYRERKIYF